MITEQQIRLALLKDTDRWIDSSMFDSTPKFLHVIIVGDNEQMLLVAKQMALLAHFPNFNEAEPDSRTRITILGKKVSGDTWKKTFGNLLMLEEHKDWTDVPVDIIVEHIALPDHDKKWEKHAKQWITQNYSPQRIQVVYDIPQINSLLENKQDIISNNQRENLAMHANMVYEASQNFDIIRADDARNIKEYQKPIQRFLQFNDSTIKAKWESLNEWNKNSNYCLADSIYVRVRSLEMWRKKCSSHKSLYDILVEHLSTMSVSEHSRWNVEKLITGFRPYTRMEVITDEMKIGSARKEYESKLKNDPKILAHIDLCSYNRLRRIDLTAVKYDSFLLLAMVRYWEKM